MMAMENGRAFRGSCEREIIRDQGWSGGCGEMRFEMIRCVGGESVFRGQVRASEDEIAFPTLERANGWDAGNLDEMY
ncbi:hypothetical protein COLO4_33315 [Corchorus olitorius]|uniref:Uncharacterized protein n=1 Tax=Corchorus olitorius TaxID=93759 RepID=A0A1R3GUR3_9ROSI|nr:hypothetical protein COLO4_33315 [Corchorus olitorius]